MFYNGTSDINQVWKIYAIIYTLTTYTGTYRIELKKIINVKKKKTKHIDMKVFEEILSSPISGLCNSQRKLQLHFQKQERI